MKPKDKKLLKDLALGASAAVGAILVTSWGLGQLPTLSPHGKIALQALVGVGGAFGLAKADQPAAAIGLGSAMVASASLDAAVLAFPNMISSSGAVYALPVGRLR